MKVLHENISRPPTTSLNCRDFDLTVFDCPYHRHPEFEIVRIDLSRGRMMAGDYIGRFKPGEVYVFGSLLPHAFLNDAGTTRARSRCLQFEPELIGESASLLPELRAVDPIFGRAERGLLLRGETARAVSTGLNRLFAAHGISRLAELFRILERMAEREDFEELASEGYSVRQPDRHMERLEAALNHIHRHIREPLHTATLAEQAGMSESAFHRLFRQRMGRSPGAFIQDVRLSSIARQLLESDASVSEIAFAAGFNNLSNFNRQFRNRFGCTPRDYRATHADPAAS